MEKNRSLDNMAIKPFPLHPAQRDIYTDQLIDVTSAQYNIGGYIRLKGALDTGKLHKAVASAPLVFDAFKIRFDLHETEPFCYFDEDYHQALMTDLDFSGRSNPEEEAINWMQERFHTPFNLEKQNPLFEQCLLKIAADEHWFFGRYHHLMADGYGFVVWIQYMAQKYKSLVANDGLEFTFPSYKEEIEKSSEANSRDYEADAAYWKEKINSKPGNPLLKKQHKSSTERRSITYILNLTQEQRALLDQIQLTTKSGLQQLTIAALLVYLGKTSDQSEFIFGIPVHKRSSKRLRNVVGTFTGILPFKGFFQPGQKLGDLLKEIIATQRTDYRHQSYLVGDLTRHLKINAAEGYLSDIIINYEPLNFGLDYGENINATIARLTNEDERNPLKIVWRDYSSEQPLQLHIHYLNGYFSREEIELFAQRLLFVLEQFPVKLEEQVESIDVLPFGEAGLIAQFNNTNVAYPLEKTIIDLFEQQVLKTPDSAALAYGERQLTYAEINGRSNQLAAYLRSRGVKQETLVAICTERSVEMIIAILGVLKAGAAYMPIDPDYPIERIDYMLEDSGAVIIISDKKNSLKLPANEYVNVIEIDNQWAEIGSLPAHNPQYNIAPHNLAYVIYTSGSTGNPKGVMIEHKGIVNLSLSQVQAFRLKAGTRILQFASVGFDASCSEIFTTLISGGCLVLNAKDELLSAEGFENLICKHNIEVATLPPSYQKVIINNLGTLKTIVSAGEPLNEATGRLIQSKGIRLINAYGPTENTVCVSLTDEPIKEDHTIVIGKPISNVQVYILSKENELLPIGVIGEICVAGVQVARGYLNRPELTEEKFISNPFANQTKIYKTGDVGRWLIDGSIEYLGRIDDQVKIRGYRIEPGEIENVLEQSEFVQQAVVLAKEDNEGNKRLVAYVVANGLFDKEAIAAELSNKLPEYMVPALWVELESFPTTASGKIDRKSLPDPQITGSTNKPFEAPRNQFEEQLAGIWQDLLGVDNIGINDNFFELGGDSIITIQVVSRLRRLGYELEVGDIFTHQTIAAISTIIKTKDEVTTTYNDQELLTGACGLLPIQQWYLDNDDVHKSHYNQSVLLSIDKSISQPVITSAVETIVTHHDALRFKYYKQDGIWLQEYTTVKGQLIMEDLPGVSTTIEAVVEEVSARHQLALDITKGELVRVVWIKTPQAEVYNRLLIIIHHLAVDGVSWRILLEDLELLINGLTDSQKAEPGKKTASYRQWYNSLLSYSNTKRLLSQSAYWKQIVDNYSPLPVDNVFDGKLTLRDTANHTIQLSSEHTRQLLQEVPKAYHTEVNDILLAALAKTLCEWNAADNIVIGLEGHGRENIEEGVDTSHTVGWFTSLFPVLLQADGDRETGDWIKSVKESLRQVPDKGLGYGVLKYINKEASLADKDPWDIVFNYLGQLDNVVKESKWLRLATQSAMAGISEEHVVSEKLSINSSVRGGELSISWSHSKKHYNSDTIIRLAESYIANLQLFIKHCIDRTKSGNAYTPSDFGLSSTINYKELDNFLERPFKGKPIKEQVDSLHQLSGLQQGILFHGLYDVGSGTYISQFGCSLRNVDINVFTGAWHAIIKRHNMLRSAFYYDAFAIPVRCVYKEVDLPVTTLDYKDFSSEEQAAAIAEFEKSDRFRGFELHEAPLMRLALIRLSEDKYRMLWTWHHILLDGWSLPILIQDFLTTYEGLISGEEVSLNVDDTFDKFIRYIQVQDKESEEKHWRNYLNPLEESTRLPFVETSREGTGTNEPNKVITLTVDAGTTLQIKDYAHRIQVTVNTVMQGVLAYLLHSYTGSTDVVYGVTVSGRPDTLQGVEESVGMYINTLPLYSHIQEGEDVTVWLQRLQTEQLTSRRFQHTPLLDIQGWSNIPRDLFDTLLVFENYPISKVLSTGKWSLQLDDVRVHDQSNFPLTIAINDSEEIVVQFNYNPRLIKDLYIQRMCRHFNKVLMQFAGSPNLSFNAIQLNTADDEHLINEFNNTATEYPKENTIVDIFQQQVVATPDAVAVVYDGERLTYNELNERSNQLASYLITKGVGEGTLVPLIVERNMDMVVSLLGILKAGGAFIPVDPEYPQERIDYVLSDINATVAMVSATSREKVKGNTNIELIDLDEDQVFINNYGKENLLTALRPDSLAYVIYTSGSTGKPKGVMVPHMGNVNMSLDQVKQFNVTVRDKVLQFASIAFDASVYEIFMALYSGASLVILNKEVIQNPENFASNLREAGITIATLPPVYLKALRIDDLKFLRVLITAGEAADVEDAAYLSNYVDYYNAYGPTECSVCVSIYKVKPEDVKRNRIPIGKPIANTKIFILDQHLRLVPLGIKGEMYVSGVGLAKGYLGLPELTKERFIISPFNNERLYRTGDLGRWLPDGNIEFIGRRDDQIKLRGHRVELGEIENTLDQHKHIEKSVVIVNEIKEDKQLIIYFQPKGNVDKDELRDFLKSKLPNYMVPSLFVEVESFPLTISGKIDKKALPVPAADELLADQYIAPRTDTQKALAEIWKKVLKLKQAGIQDNFFDLGGHSLLAIRLISAIRAQLNLDVAIKVIFDHPTIESLAAQLDSSSTSATAPSIVSQPRSGLIPLSFSQERLWFIDQFEGSTQYHSPGVLRLRGKLDEAALNKTLQAVIDRHEVLRTVFKEQGGKPYQHIKDKGDWKLNVVDGIKYKHDHKGLREYIGHLVSKPFRLSEDHMLRADLITLAEEENVLVVVMHHIASDGWSMPILINEVAALYKAFEEGGEANLAPLQLQYADYAIWQRNYLTPELLEEKTNYWKEKLEDVQPLQLPTDLSRPASRSSAGSAATFTLNKELLEQLNALSQQQGTTLYMTLLAAFKVLLHRYSNQEDICVGTSIANRNRQEIEGLIGFFVNTLALRDEVKSDASFISLLQQVRVTTLEAYEHQDVPFEKVVEEVVKERDPSRSPLFQVMLVLVNTPEVPELRLGELSLSPETYDQATVKFDITFFITETVNGLQGHVEYSTDLYNADTINQLTTHFSELLYSVVKNPTVQVGLLPMVTKEEQHRLTSNSSNVEYPKHKTIVALFEEQVKKTPNAIAIIFEGKQLTYEQLNARANQLAHHLKQRGIMEESLVPLCIERSAEMMIGILGILKAGAAYVPVDTDFPQERINYMLQDTGATVIVSSTASRSITDHSSAYIIEVGDDGLNDQSMQNPTTKLRPDHLAYVIYTSGSTGMPKGVMVEHRNLVDYVFGLDKKININACKSFALVSTIATDLGNTVIYNALLSGGTLHLFSKEAVSNIQFIHNYFHEHIIDCIKIVPSHWKALSADENLLLPKKLLVFGGEALQAEVAEQISLARTCCTIVNHYGPTETTVGKLLHIVEPGRHYVNTIPIGKPFTNTQVYVLSKALQLCPVGVPGQLYIAGDGVARGYLNNPDLTQAKFIHDPFSKHKRSMYGTGDLVKILPDGNISFIGRVDDQVKIRGYRVEPGEIESIMQQCELVSQAVVLAKQDNYGSRRLVAYVVPEGGRFDREGMLAYLGEKLPDYMIPSTIIELESLPLTPNGKVDRKALPDPDTLELLKDKYIAPRNNAEVRMAEIWQDVLEVEQVGVNDDFFELGGHSLLAVRLISAIRKEFIVEMPISHVFDYPTVALLSSHLEDQSESVVLPSIDVVKTRPEFIPLSFSQERLWFIDKLEGSIQYHVPAVLMLNGKLNKDALAFALKNIITRHEVLRTVIRENEGQPHQHIQDVKGWQLNIINGEHYENGSKNLQKDIEALINAPFDLSKDYMLRADLIRLKEDEYVLIITLHHIASDGWSRSVLVKELVDSYRSFEQGKESTLAILDLQYADYAIWQRTYLQGQVLDRKMQYWKEKLFDVAPLQLPLDFSRPAILGTKGAINRFTIERNLSDKLKELSQQHDVTLFMTLLSAFKVLLYQYSGQSDICIGTPIAGRQQHEVEKLIGFFVNTLAIRSEIDGEAPFINLLQQVRASMLEAYEHQEVPFEKVVDEVVKERDMGRNPLFQVMFVLRNTPDVPQLQLGEVLLTVEEPEHTTAMFDIQFFITEVADGLDCVIEYNTDLYRPATIERLHLHFQKLLGAVIKAPQQKIGTLSILSPAEEEQVTREFNNTRVHYPASKSIVDLFEEQVSKSPEATAIVFEDRELTYRELNDRSNQLARYLQSKGVKAETLVPICLERTPEMIVGILGILKAGGAYVPVDPEYPLERIQFTLEDTAASLVVTSSKSINKLPALNNVEAIEIDSLLTGIENGSTANLKSKIAPHQLAYVIYTSGSTGKPKGVMIEHHNVYAFICWSHDEFAASNFDVVYATTSMCFDLSVYEFFYPLITGKKLRIIENGLHIGRYLPDDRNVLINSVPVVVENLLKERTNLGNVNVINMAGEPIPLHVQQGLDTDRIEVRNLYGPTEDTTYTTIYKVTKDQPILIGKPISNTSIYILGKHGQLLPVGIAGEICIAGAGVARGYLNRPELTAQKFVLNPFNKEEDLRLYKTGDLGRWLPNGNIEYLGRIDNQVKVRGYRIELGEVETAMNELEYINNSCVLVKKEDNGANRLLSYYVADNRLMKLREQELYKVRVKTWKEVYETEYATTEAEENIDHEFNIIGWNDSFTGQPIPEEQMRDWLKDIIQVILSGKPQNVLEIGCGTGLIYYQLAGKVSKYIGTDFSRSSINQIKNRISKGYKEYGPTELKVAAAHEVELSENDELDTVIINSVIQYFPGQDYLTDVIEKSISHLRGGGRIIIGDVRDNRLLELFKSRLQLNKLQHSVSIKEFKWAVQQDVIKEEELCFSPAYFYHLQSLFPAISHVDIQWKHAAYDNELSLYRYTVIIHVGTPRQVIEPDWQSWQDVLNRPKILQQISDAAPVIALKDVPNPRLQKEIQLTKALQDKTISTVSDIQSYLTKEDTTHLETQAMLEAAEAAGYNYKWLVDEDPLKVNLFIELNPSDAFIKQPYSEKELADTDHYTNTPLFNDISLLLQKDIRALLQQRLPDYMIPSELFALAQLPLTANGKVDRKFLSEREAQGVVKQLNYQPPVTEVEKKLVSIWQELLGIDRIGISDNFFELGGHSLLAIRLISAIRDQWEVELLAKDIFMHATIHDLGKYIEIQTNVYSVEDDPTQYEIVTL